MLEDRLNQDLKQALLSGDKTLATTLRGLKSALLYAKIAAGARDSGLTDEASITVLQKEAKKRQESADLYLQGGDKSRAEAELTEKAVIERYLPAQLSEVEIAGKVDEAIAALGGKGQAQMGPVIAQVKQVTGGAADGSLIARLTRERLQP